MYARLWWKEARSFWPIWLALGLIAAGVQWVLLRAGGPEMRTGLLIVLGVCWAMLYAFAVGAAALAGERETNTQLFLDMLPVGRGMLWSSKVSFALATTLALALVLAVHGAAGSVDHNPLHYPLGTLAAGFGVVLLEGVAWSLLWSTLLDSALWSAVLGLVSVGVLNMVLCQSIDLWDPAVLARWAVVRLALAGGALALSGGIFTRRPQPDRSIAVAAAVAEQEVRDVPRRSIAASWFGALGATVGRLAWETARESGRVWLGLLGVCVVLLLAGPDERRAAAPILAVVGCLTSLAAGVSVFGPMNRTRSYRFLVYHGVRPSTVWACRVAVWGIVAGGLILTVLGLAVVWNGPGSRVLYSIFLMGFLSADGFLIGLFCGQVLRRSITAWVVACLVLVLLVPAQVGLVETEMIPVGSLVLFPALILALSWAWTGDWMNDLRGAGRWWRLGGSLAAAAALLFGSYAGYRAWSVPEVDVPAPLMGTPAAAASLPPETKLEPKPELVQDAARNQEPRPVRDDLAEAREDQRVIWPIPRRWSRSGTFDAQIGAARSRQTSFEVELTSAADPRQTPARFYSVLAEVRALPPLAPFPEVLKAEYARIAGEFRRGEDDPYLLIRYTMPDRHRSEFERVLVPMLLAPPWERSRGIRVLHLWLWEQLELGQLEPWERWGRSITINEWLDVHATRGGSKVVVPAADLERYLQNTPLARIFRWSAYPVLAARDQDLLLSRALEQVVALRIWQLEHQGKYPETLEALVPELLPSLPPDPYSGQPFRYRKAEGQKLLPLGLSGRTDQLTGDTSRTQATRPGQWLLYSVGPNRTDDGARIDYETDPARADLIFPLPAPE
jgi:hypothetical protein